MTSNIKIENVVSIEALPEMIVCFDSGQVQKVRAQTSKNPNIFVVSQHAAISAFSGRTVARVIVCEGVDLTRDVCGEGSLEAVLRDRQATWGANAVFIVL